VAEHRVRRVARVARGACGACGVSQDLERLDQLVRPEVLGVSSVRDGNTGFSF
jgi:hypothetical protein